MEKLFCETDISRLIFRNHFSVASQSPLHSYCLSRQHLCTLEHSCYKMSGYKRLICILKFRFQDKGMNCLMGETVVYERRKQMSECFVGEEYFRPKSSQPCSCTEEDFEWYLPVSNVTCLTCGINGVRSNVMSAACS